jgi:drug/metabolite transporter (DMT)-like permease
VVPVVLEGPQGSVAAGIVAVGAARVVAAAEAVVRLRLWIAFAALGVAWGTTWIASDTLAESVPPLGGAAARFLLSALLCIPVIRWKRLKMPWGRALGVVLLLSLTMIALPTVLLLWAEPRLSSATVTVLFAAMPLLLTVLDPKVVPRSALQACIVALGAMALVVSASFSVAQAGGAAVALLAVISIAVSVLLARRELSGVHPVVVTAWLLGAAALLLALAATVLERGQPVGWSRSAIGSVLFLAGVGGAPAYAAYFWLLQRLQPYQVATLQWVEPLVAIGESAFSLRIGLSFPMVAGSLITLLCLLLVMRTRVEDDNPVSLWANS